MKISFLRKEWRLRSERISKQYLVVKIGHEQPNDGEEKKNQGKELDETINQDL